MQDERLVVGDFASPSGSGPRGDAQGVQNPCVVASAHLYLGSVFVLGEGLGAEGGRVESRIAVSAVLTQFRGGAAQDPRHRLVEALRHASEVMRGRAQTGPLFHNAFARCLAVLVRRGRLYAARVGNIELALMQGKGGGGRALTRAFQWLPSESECLLGQGDEPSVEVLADDVQLEPGDRFLLSNAALFTAVPEEEIRRLATGLLPAVAARRLVEAADRSESGVPVTVQVIQAGDLLQQDDVPEPGLPARTSAASIHVGEPIGLVVPTVRQAHDEGLGPAPAPERVEAPRRHRPLPAPFAVGPLTAPTLPRGPAEGFAPDARAGVEGSGPLALEGQRGRVRTPPRELADPALGRPEGDRGLRWLGGVSLIALLAVAFSWAFPRPSAIDTAESEPTLQPPSAPTGPAPSVNAPAGVPVEGVRPGAAAFWLAVSRHFAATDAPPDAEQLKAWLGLEADARASRLQELRGLLAALDASPVLAEAAPSPAVEVPGEPIDAPAAAPAEAPGEPVAPELPSAFADAEAAPTAVPEAEAAAQPDADPPAAAPAAAPSGQRTRQQRHLDNLFRPGRPADESAQMLRDYIHHRHEKVEAVIAALDSYIDAAPAATQGKIPGRQDLARVISRLSHAQPGPRTRAWAKAALARLR